MVFQYTITQFPSTTSAKGNELGLSGSNNIVWRDGTKIKLFNGGRTIQLAEDGTDLAISGNLVAWATTYDKGGVMLYDGKNKTSLLKATAKDIQIVGNKLVWTAAPGAGGQQKNEIYIYNGKQPVQLTVGGNDKSPQLSGDYLVYQDASGSVRLYNTTNGNSRVLSTGTSNSDAKIDNNIAVWRSGDDVMLYNIANGVSLNLTSFIANNSANTAPQVAGNYVVWSGNDGSDTEIYLYNINTGVTNKLTNNSTNDSDVRIAGNSIVWSGNDGTDQEIYVYDVLTQTTAQVTNNTTDDVNPRISGSSIAWVGLDKPGATTGNVFMATRTIEDATTNVLPDDVDNVKLIGFRSINYQGNKNNNVILGNTGRNKLEGLAGNDYMTGNSGRDTLLGGDGDDYLLGGGSRDSLTGGAGRDTFVFDIDRSFSRLRMGNDNVTDFKDNEDLILLDKSTFTKLGDGALSFKSVLNRADADKSNALIVYARSTGALYYNENGIGNGYGRGGQFADLGSGLNLTASNFLVQA